jgi:hypothetical protein
MRRSLFTSEKVRMSELNAIEIELPAEHLKKHEKMLTDAHFLPVNEEKTLWQAPATHTNRVNADRIVREIAGRPLEAYAGMRR